MRLADPDLGINFRMLLHAEQSLQMQTIDEIYASERNAVAVDFGRFEFEQ